jgi:hypothetical protein
VNINYDEIISKANARKDALKAFERAVEDLSSEINETPAPLIEALRNFYAKFQALDQEALKLIGGDAVYPLTQFAASMLALWEHLEKVDPYRHSTPRGVLGKLQGL